eukprot:8998758-Pyramimonas_sp.AAC.1
MHAMCLRLQCALPARPDAKRGRFKLRSLSRAELRARVLVAHMDALLDQYDHSQMLTKAPSYNVRCTYRSYG